MAENPAVLIANFPKRKTLKASSANLCTSVPAEFTPLGIPSEQKILRVAPEQRPIRANQAGTFRISRRKSLAGPALFSQPKDDWKPLAIVLRRGLGAKRQ